jgi:hypothetical protein
VKKDTIEGWKELWRETDRKRREAEKYRKLGEEGIYRTVENVVTTDSLYVGSISGGTIAVASTEDTWWHNLSLEEKKLIMEAVKECK